MEDSRGLIEPIGSMADVPKDLLDHIKHLEEIFTVDQKKLKDVTDHFVKELEKGKAFCLPQRSPQRLIGIQA